jgi:DNA-binding transcriptional MocR family regulator
MARAKPGARTSKSSRAGVDLHLDLSGPRVRLGLERALRDAVRTDRLAPGTRLPSSRALAADLGLARNTVAEVYSQLVAEGWLTARTGSGTSVAERRAVDPGPGAATRREVPEPRYDLRLGVPDLSGFPRRAWLATARKVLAAAPSAASGLDQLILAEFISSGGYDRQVRRARLEYRRRRDRLAAALHRQGLHVTGIAAGLHAVLELPGTDAERQLIARATRHGLALQGLESFRAAGPAAADPGQVAPVGPSTTGSGQAGLVIGYGRPPEHAYTTALARLCAVLGPDGR